MKLYLEVDNYQQILDRIDTKLIDGIVIKKTDPKTYRKTIVDCISFDTKLELIENVIVQVDGNSPEEILKNSMEIGLLDPNIKVNIPDTLNGLNAVKLLKDQEINSVVFCSYYKSFIYRNSLLEEIFVDFQKTEDISSVVKYYSESSCEIMASNISTLDEYCKAVLYNVDGVVLSVEIFDQFLNS